MDEKRIPFERINQQKKSPIRVYADRVAGSLLRLPLHEFLIFLLKNREGLPGFILRLIFYPLLLNKYGKGSLIGSRVTLCNPQKIKLGKRVVLDEGVTLDVKSSRAKGISLDDGVILERDVLVSAGYEGEVIIGENTSIGPRTLIFGPSRVEIGKGVLIAGQTVLAAIQHHLTGGDGAYIYEQGSYGKGIVIKDNVWIGAGVKILDGVTIGEGAVIGAGAVVTRDFPPRCIAAGIPAKVIKEY